MGTYVGEIKISGKNGFFVNFYPGYQLIGNSFEYLSRQDIMNLLPGSQYLNINIVCSSSSMSLEDLFQDGDDVLIDFSFEDLQPNLKADGSRYPTAWKLDISRDFGAGLRRMEDLGFYYSVDAGAIAGDWKEDGFVELDSPDVNEGMEVMIPSDRPNVLIGPFRVHYDEDRQIFYVRTNAEGRKFIIGGFEYLDGPASHYITLEQEDVTRNYVPVAGPQIRPYSYDQISLEDLMENFRALISRRMPRQYRFDADTARQMVRIYQNSLLSGSGISPEAAQKRSERLLELLNSQAHFDQTLDQVAKLAGDLLAGFKDEPVYSRILDVLSQDKNFLSQIGSFQQFSLQKARLEEQIAALEASRARLDEQVRELETLNPEKKIEEAKSSLKRLENLRRQAQSKLDTILHTTNIVENLDDLQRQSEYLDAENDRKAEESRRLDLQLKDLQTRLDGVLENSASRALELTFDNLIAERFMEQSTRMQRRALEEKSYRAARAIGTLPVSNLDEEQTVALLLHGFKQYRPEYTDNEILNLFICLTQGFLTILSGPPGSGKSSVCRIAAQVLGLDKPGELESMHSGFPNCSRFVNISVERGWTSSRDWIGFYNSLTHTFDQSSPELFDLLSVMDAETHTSSRLRVLPALVLLDDANLSSMEYYWGGFMSMDQPDLASGSRGTLNLGPDYRFQIQGSLHFAATIQSDHTTETLSDRLLDRAFVITMPEHTAGFTSTTSPLPVMESQLFTENQLRAAFEPSGLSIDLPARLEEQLESLKTLFAQAGCPVSIRSEAAIRKYILSGMRWFVSESEEERDPGLIALDYAVLQRMMPRLHGSSELFRSQLCLLNTFFKENEMHFCQRKLEKIMEAGDDSMQYYQFFS